jgi:hypothetical protein
MLGNEAIVAKISRLTYTVREPTYAQPVANSEVARNDNLRIEHLRFTLIATHYAKNTPDYDIYFIAFSGEDANLRGSEWYAQHPVAPLSEIKYILFFYKKYLIKLNGVINFVAFIPG